MDKKLLQCFAFLLFSSGAWAQDSFTVRAQRYIAQYYNLAVAEQKRSGVPASVTLAQGVLETEAGKSELVCMANNHFGIKCKNDYAGDKFFHDDDHPKECFKMYRCAEESYKDHSDYLKRNKRYTPLFVIPPTDYCGWATGLKRCGYATNPQYAQRLIKIIEDFHLQAYTYYGLDSATTEFYNLAFETDEQVRDSAKMNLPDVAKVSPAKEIYSPVLAGAPRKMLGIALPFGDTTKKQDSAAPAAAAPAAPKVEAPAVVAAPTKVVESSFDSGKIIAVNGLKAFYAKKGDVLLQYAVKYNVRYSHLLEMNDLQDAPLPYDMVVYLERKLVAGSHAKHVVKDGETLLLVAQLEGMQLKRLMALNMLEAGDEPAVGANLELQNGAAHKPALRGLPDPDLKTAPNLSFTKPTPKDDFIPVTHTKHADTALAAVKKEINRDTYVTTIHVPVDAAKKAADSLADWAPKAIDTAAALKHSESPQTATMTLKPEPKTEAVKKVEELKPTVVAQVDSTKNAVDTTEDELAALKSKLDKVVYADNSKLIPPPVKGEIKEPIKLSTTLDGPTGEKPVKEKAVAKNKAAAYYVVKKGDTITSIAHKNKLTIKQLEKLNDIDLDNLRLGQKIRLK